MKINLKSIEGSFNFEQRNDCRITRTIYYWNPDGYQENYSLLRIYEFPNQTVVIASQLRGIVLGNENFILDAIDYFSIQRKNLIWINHQGIFSDYKPTHDIFSKKTLKLNFLSCEFEAAEEISLTQVKELVGFDLEPVETGLGLDPKLQQKMYIEQQGKINKLIQIYLKLDQDYFLKRLFEIEQVIKNKRFLVAYSPSRRIEEQDRITLLTEDQIKEGYYKNYHEANYLIDNYDPGKEILVGLYFKDESAIIGVVSRRYLLGYNEDEENG